MRARRVRLDKEVLEVANRWREQYLYKGKWKPLAGGDSEKVYLKLWAEGGEITVEKAEKIIGNDSWTSIYCDGCDKKVKSDLVEVGSDDCGGNHCFLCRDCVFDAMKVLY